jgi:nucleotide-binding universal stress UspA family protein
MNHGRCIVVGYDGSPSSRAALARAGRVAGSRGLVHVVHAYSLPNDLLPTPGYQRLLDTERERAQRLVAGLEEEAGPDLQAVEWTVELIGARPARAIADFAKARDADEIIVGSRGRGRAGAMLGSVAHELIHLAACPVTVIPERALARAGHTSPGRVSGRRRSE